MIQELLDDEIALLLLGPPVFSSTLGSSLMWAYAHWISIRPEPIHQQMTAGNLSSPLGITTSAPLTVRECKLGTICTSFQRDCAMQLGSLNYTPTYSFSHHVRIGASSLSMVSIRKWRYVQSIVMLHPENSKYVYEDGVSLAAGRSSPSLSRDEIVMRSVKCHAS